MKENKIKATVVQHTKSCVSGVEMISFELDMPRSLLAELNTHKILVRNAQSSRAVPVKVAIEKLLNGETYYEPSYWGKNQSGMSASEENDEKILFGDYTCTRERVWKEAMLSGVSFAKDFDKAGYHKQIVGRLLEPFSMVKVLLSGTEWDNFFNLRVHPAAEPHFRDLAIKMYLALRGSEPVTLIPGEWHLPYIKYSHNDYGNLIYIGSQGEVLDLETARIISLSCVAQTSYRKHDDSVEKADVVISRLFNGDVVHASPAEHLSTPMKHTDAFLGEDILNLYTEWEKGVTHMDRVGNLWSGQFRHFIQYRQLIPNNVCNEFTHEKFLEYTKREIV